MIRLKIGLIVAGVILVFVGIKEARLSNGAKAAPQVRTYHELITRGPGDSAYIRLSEFVACGDDFIYEALEGEDNGPYDTVYLPAVKLGGEWTQKLLALMDENGNIPDGVPIPKPDTRKIRVLLKLTNIRLKDHIAQAVDKETLDGMIVNGVAPLGPEEKRLLRKGYPGLNIDACYIIEVGRTPGIEGRAVALIIIGATLGLVGLLWLPASLGKNKTIKPPRRKKKELVDFIPPPPASAKAGPEESSEANPVGKKNFPDDASNTMTRLAENHKNPYAGS